MVTIFERSDRQTGSGGGVGCYIRNDIGYHRRTDLERDGIESLLIEVFRKNSRSILVCILYRPPDTSRHLHKNFQEKLDEMIEISVSEYKETIVLGDVNCYCMKNSAHPEIKNIFTRNGLKQIIKRPTRITKDTHSLIDIIATSHENNINNYIVFPNSISDSDLTGASI